MVYCEPQKLQEISELCCFTVFSTEPHEILSPSIDLYVDNIYFLMQNFNIENHK